ncbi:MAG TPA: hypothetical protein VFJ71_07510 [Candidatus Limnocylindrales bacterium]|nr:hypothetical protein [Candidatus Limnocylindrales bacterium]
MRGRRPCGRADRSGPLNRREAALSAGVVFVAALLVRWYAASLVVFPKPEDTAYYVDVARNLLAGRGLVTDALWSFQTPPLVVPRAAFEVWLPLPTFAAAIPMAVLGSTFAAAQVSSVLIGSLVPVLAWRLAADVAEERAMPPGRARTLAIGTGLTAAVSLPLILHSTLPDSTMPFAALTLSATLLITRIRARVRESGSPTGATRLLVALGVVLGLAALTRNEALWLALSWAVLAWTLPVSRRDWAVLVAIPAGVALVFFVPWMVRDWLAFGSPLPGQALTNALSVEGTDIFAWHDPPTLARYLAVGPARLVEMRLTGIEHNLMDVLLVPGAPLSFIGLVALPWTGRSVALRPLVLVSILLFLITSLVFPVSTTWGTFLHAAGAVHVLLVISALLALDRLIVWVGARRGWTRPVAWLAPALTMSGASLFSALLLPTFGDGSVGTARTFAVLHRQLQVAIAIDDRPASRFPAPRVITDYPIWLPYVTDASGIALPHEPPISVVDLGHRLGAGYVVVVSADHPFPAAVASRALGWDCFEPVDLPTPPDPDDARAVADVRAYRVVC